MREYVPGACHGNAEQHAANQGGVEPSCPRLSHVSPLYSQFAPVWTPDSATATGLAPVVRRPRGYLKEIVAVVIWLGPCAKKVSTVTVIDPAEPGSLYLFASPPPFAPIMSKGAAASICTRAPLIENVSDAVLSGATANT